MPPIEGLNPDDVEAIIAFVREPTCRRIRITGDADRVARAVGADLAPTTAVLLTTALTVVAATVTDSSGV